MTDQLYKTLYKDEIWKEIPGYEGYYAVSNIGRVKSLDRYVGHPTAERSLKIGTVRKLQLANHNYWMVSLSKNMVTKLKSVHRLVASTFIPNPEKKKEVNHINGNRRDNRIENLEWCTRSENAKHAFDIGLSTKRKGSKHPMATITEKDVVQMKIMKRNGMKPFEIAKNYDLSYSSVCRILKGRTWSHVNIPEDQYIKVTDKFNPYK